MALSYKNDEQQDERLDPYSDSARDLYHQEQDAYDREFNDIEKNFNESADSNAEDENIKKTKNVNEAQEKESSPNGSWTSNVSGNSDKQKLDLKTNLKKKGPLGAIIGLLLGGGGAFTIMFSPGIGIVQLKEAMLGDLNDQLAAMDIRTDHLFRTKLKAMQAGASICSDGVKIRCKYATMSKRQVAKFKKAGFIIEPTNPDARFGRTKPTSITFPPEYEGGPRVTVTDPNELRNHLLSSSKARSAFRKTFNPKFSGLSDAIADKVFGRYRTNKATKITGTTSEERAAAMASATAGQSAGIDADGKLRDTGGNEYVIDEDGNRVYATGPPEGAPDGSTADEGKFNEIAENNRSKLTGVGNLADTARSTGKSAVGNALKSGFRGVSIIGVADTACTVYNTARAVAAAAKATRALQLFQFAMVFFNVADRIKAGEATPGEVEYIGNKLTAVDTQKMIIDEESVKDENDEPVPHENPYYGYNAFDSPGYKVAAYNEAPILTSRDAQYTIGGGLVGTLSGVMDKIVEYVPGGRSSIRSTCSVVQSWWARGLGLIVGVVSAIGSGFTTLAISVGASIAIGFAMPFLEAALADILAGTVVTPDTEGVDAGNAVFSGAGALFGAMAMGHGMPPASSGELKSYLARAQEVKQDYIAMETYEAQATPFDITKQYSFLGSFVRTVNPTLTKSTASISGALTNIPALFSSALTSVVPNANAAVYQNFNDARFQRCEDEGYDELGIDADVFCNVRYYMSNEQLAMDPDVAAAWMISNGHIEEDGSPKSDKYKDWIKYCTEREDGWGESGDSEGYGDKEIGKDCVKNEDFTKYAPVFYMDKSINDAMDTGSEPVGEEETAFWNSSVVPIGYY